MSDGKQRGSTARDAASLSEDRSLRFLLWSVGSPLYRMRWIFAGGLGIGFSVLVGILGAHTEGFWSGTFSGMSTLLLCLAFYCLGRIRGGVQ